MPFAAYSPFTPPLHSWQLHPIASRYFTSWLETKLLNAPDPTGWTTGVQAKRDLAASVLSFEAR